MVYSPCEIIIPFAGRRCTDLSSERLPADAEVSAEEPWSRRLAGSLPGEIRMFLTELSDEELEDLRFAHTRAELPRTVLITAFASKPKNLHVASVVRSLYHGDRPVAPLPGGDHRDRAGAVAEERLLDLVVLAVARSLNVGGPGAAGDSDDIDGIPPNPR